MSLEPSGVLRSPRYAESSMMRHGQRSITHRCAVAPGVCTAFQKSAFVVDADGVRMTHIVIPVGDHLDRLPTSLELAHDLVGDSAFQRQVA